MKTLLAKSYRFNRFHFAVVVIIVALLVWVLERFFAMASAELEKVSFQNNIQFIHQSLMYKQLVKPKNNTCQLIEHIEFLEKSIFGYKLKNPDTSQGPKLKKWIFFPETKSLKYQVQNPRFFRSPLGNAISVNYFCKENKVHYKVSSHQWCKKISIWGCLQW